MDVGGGGGRFFVFPRYRNGFKKFINHPAAAVLVGLPCCDDGVLFLFPCFVFSPEVLLSILYPN